MIRRARICLELASVAAVFGFTGVLESGAAIARVMFYILIAFSLLSFGFGLFEPEAEPHLVH